MLYCLVSPRFPSPAHPLPYLSIFPYSNHSCHTQARNEVAWSSFLPVLFTNPPRLLIIFFAYCYLLLLFYLLYFISLHFISFHFWSNTVKLEHSIQGEGIWLNSINAIVLLFSIIFSSMFSVQYNFLFFFNCYCGCGRYIQGNVHIWTKNWRILEY